MKAAVYIGKDNLELKTVAKPELTMQGAIIKVNGCGLCGSDIVKLKQGLTKKESILGHEISGKIQKIVGNENFKAGDRVVLGHHVPCYECVFCRNENYSMCREFKLSNIFPGGFCEYIYISEKHLKNTVQKIPKNLPDEHASFTEPVACCLRAAKRAAVRHGDLVLVTGLGSIGLIMGQVLKYYGAKVIGCDLLDERIQIAKDLGFDAAYKYINDADLSGVIKKNFQQEGVDKVFLTSGSSKNISTALYTIRDGGTILVFASISGDKAGFPNNDIYYRELTVLGSYSPSPEDLKDSLKLIEKNVIKVDNLYTIYDLKDINQAIFDTISNKIIKAYIKIS